MTQQRGFIGQNEFWWFVAVLFCVGLVVGIFISVVPPIVWDWVKPIIHKWSA